MAKEADRHVGRRENVWFPWCEHKFMCDAMNLINETNKSNFIRSAVRFLAKTIQEGSGK